MNMQVKSGSVEQTQQLAEGIGSCLRGGEVIELISDVGGGKTTFVRGLAKGAGSKDHVSSPTFTISKIYNAPKFQIAHFDFYRLQEAGLIEHEIQEAISNPEAVVVIEWSDVVQHVLPEERLTITITKTSDDGRAFMFNHPEKYAYLTEGLALY